MYTVVVADDEQELREAIVSKVNWEAQGFTVVGSAENGIEALELVEKYKPDLLLTDIKMPFFSGIELARRVREIRPSIQIAFLSGYDDFEYARQGIQYNIVSYLLKPISAGELEAALRDIRAKLDEKFLKMRGSGEDGDLSAVLSRLSVTEFLLPLFLSGSEYLTEDAVRRRASELHIAQEDGSVRFAVIVSKFNDEQGKNRTEERHIAFVESVLGKYMGCRGVIINGRVVSLLSTESGGIAEALELPLKELMQSAERVLGLRCSVGVSRETDSLCNCSGAYYEALTARRYADPEQSDARFISDQEQGGIAGFEYAEKTASELEQLMKTGDRQVLEDYLGQVFSESNEKNLDQLVIQTLAAIYKTANSVLESSAAAELLSQNPIYDKIVLHDAAENIRKTMMQLCMDTREAISCQRRQSSQLLCDEALHIIDTEYGDTGLTLGSVSARLHVSPNYLSSRITRSGREPFSSLLTARRMASAKNSLLCSSMKIMEIAQCCGYSDQHYFSYCFKKYYGVSPNKMREDVCRDSKGE